MQIIPGIVLVGVLVLLFIYAANQYNKSQKKIEQHKANGDITDDADL